MRKGQRGRITVKILRGCEKRNAVVTVTQRGQNVDVYKKRFKTTDLKTKIE